MSNQQPGGPFGSAFSWSTPTHPDQGNTPQGQYPPQTQYTPQYSQQPVPNVVIRQGQVQPNDYAALALMVTILCCLPLGIVAIIKSTEVHSRFQAGDYAGAEQASRQAKNWSIAGLITGSVFIGACFLFYVIWIIAL